MALVNQSEAVQAAEENNVLRTRVKQLEEEEQQRNSSSHGDTLDTTSADRLKRRNNALRDDIAELQQELRELRTVNVTELYHQYQRHDNKRAYLNNENASLRSVLANQRKDVRRATSNVNAYQEVRRQNEEQNASAKGDIKRFKEKREALQAETNRLNRKETRLQNELATMPASDEELEAERCKLAEDTAKKSARLEELAAQLEELQAQRETTRRETEAYRDSDASLADVSELRQEYLELKEQLKELK